jgi:hypothetical protein
VILVAAAIAAHAATPPSPASILIVYAQTSPDSADVAKWYAARRGVPPSNLCPLPLTDTRNEWVIGYEYEDLVNKPIRACLEAVGKRDILYIVLAYIRQFRVDPGGGLRHYALDSYLADIWNEYSRTDFDPSPTVYHSYFSVNQPEDPFVSLAVFRQDPRNPLIYSVWRLDGPTPDVAKQMVEQAIYAESHAAAGPACIDPAIERGYDAAVQTPLPGIAPSRRAAIDMLPDRSGEESETIRPPGSCSGAIGLQLNTESPTDPHASANGSAAAIYGWITVAGGAIVQPDPEALPNPAGVFRNLVEGATVGEAFLRNTPALKWRTINIGDPLYQPFPNGLTSFVPRSEIVPQDTEHATTSTVVKIAGSTSSTRGGPSPSVLLTWDASTSPDVVGYAVYRATTPFGPYAQLNTDLVTDVEYQDSSVQAGQTYYYVVTASDSSDNSSDFSDEAQAILRFRLPLPR